MAGQPMELLTGGAGMYTNQPLQVAPGTANNPGTVNRGLRPHHSVISLVLLSVLVLFLLDRAGFRFAVTAGRR